MTTNVKRYYRLFLLAGAAAIGLILISSARAGEDAEKKSEAAAEAPAKAPAKEETKEAKKPPKPVEWKIRYNVRTGSMPKGVELSPDGKEAWVTNFGNDRGKNISIFNPADGKVITTMSFSGRAVETAFSSDGKVVYVSNFDKGTLMEIDAKARKVSRVVKVGTNPKIVTISPDGGTIYVSNWTTNDVSIVDGPSFKETARVRAGHNPRGSAVDASGKYLFVANFNGHDMSVIDLAQKKKIKTIAMHKHPRHVTATPDGKWILCSNMGSASCEMAAIDPVSLEVKHWVKVGRGPKVIKVSPDSRFAFIADYYGHDVSIVDLTKMELLETIPGLGKACCGLDLSKDGKSLFVTSWYSNQLWAIDVIYNPVKDEVKNLKDEKENGGKQSAPGKSN